MVVLEYLMPLNPSYQYQPIRLWSTLLRFASGVICRFISCAGPDLSVVPSIAISEKMFSVIIGLPSPYHSYRMFRSQATSVAINPSGVLNVFSRSEEHTSELQSLMRISYAVFCLK